MTSYLVVLVDEVVKDVYLKGHDCVTTDKMVNVSVYK